MTIEFAKLVNWMNTWSTSFNCEKLVSRINDLRTGKCKIYQIKRYQIKLGEALCEKYAHEIACVSDLEQGYDIWLTSTDITARHILLNDILFKLCMAGFKEDNIADRLYAFADAYNAWSAENK